MKTMLATFALVAAAASAAPAVAGPDFVTPSPRPRELAASRGVRDVPPSDDIQFDFDSHALSPTAQQQLASAATWMKRHPRHRLVLEGYTDGSGYRVYNEDLATRRAAMARNHLIALGVPAGRIILVVYGETAARAWDDPLGRRVVFYATDRSPTEIATASLDRKGALSAVWISQGTLFTHRREPQPRVIIGAR